MDNGKGKNKVDECDPEHNYEDDFDIYSSSSSDDELPETDENFMIAEPDEPLRQISTDLVLAAPYSQIQRSQRLSGEGSGRKRMWEAGSSSQSPFHHQLETGSSSQSRFRHHLETGSSSQSQFHHQLETGSSSQSRFRHHLETGSSSQSQFHHQLETGSSSQSRFRHHLETGSSSQSQFHHQLETGSSSQSRFRHHLETGSSSQSQFRHQLETGSSSQSRFRHHLETGSSSQSQFHHQLETGSSSQSQFHHQLETGSSSQSRFRHHLETGSSSQSQFHHQLETGSSSQIQFHHQLETGSSSQRRFHHQLETGSSSQRRFHHQLETGSSSRSQIHHQLESDSGQQATQPGDNLIPPAPQLTTGFPSETNSVSPYLCANNYTWNKQGSLNKSVLERLDSLDKRVSEQKHAKGRILKLETKIIIQNEIIAGLEADNTELSCRISMLEDFVLKSIHLLERKTANDDIGSNSATDNGKSIPSVNASPCTNVGSVLGARRSDPTSVPPKKREIRFQDGGNEAENLERQGSISELDNADGPSGMLIQDDGMVNTGSEPSAFNTDRNKPITESGKTQDQKDHANTDTSPTQ
ncbi:uncharacterized protein [Spinacia oleracea]|uniref:BZIP domain-containing protein n=1 Tax=Spinacia oleracea TaxID=3562 RepID=A0A9R0I1N7_SPIOL|nr:uncharacterized protein LOC110780863 [Spinacia oleracea]